MAKRIKLDEDTVAELDYNVWEITQKHPFDDSTSSIQLHVGKFKKMGLIPMKDVVQVLTDKIDAADCETARHNQLAQMCEFAGGRKTARAHASAAAGKADALRTVLSQIKDLA